MTKTNISRTRVLFIAVAAIFAAVIAADLWHLFVYTKPFREARSFHDLAWLFYVAAAIALLATTPLTQSRPRLAPLVAVILTCAFSLGVFVAVVRITHPYSTYPEVTQTFPDGSIVYSATDHLRRAAGAFLQQLVGLFLLGVAAAVVVLMAQEWWRHRGGAS